MANENKNGISSKRVMFILKDCFFREEEMNGRTEKEMLESEDCIKVEGVVRNFGLNRERVMGHEEEICSMLSLLNDKFFPNSGGGYSFLDLPFDKFGNQWGEQIHAEALMVLGMAIGKIKYLMPRDFWGVLPGGVPYIAIDESVRKDTA